MKKANKLRRQRRRADVKKRANSSSSAVAALDRSDGAYALLRQRKFREAARLLEAERDTRGLSAKQWSELSLAYLGLEQLEAAAAAVDSAVNAGLTSASDQAGFGAEAFRSGAFQIAELAFRLATRISPDLFDAHINLAMVAHRNGNLESAIASYQAALAIQPAHASALYNLGVALKGTGDLEAATQALERSLSLQPREH